ncbi:glycosyltransferase [bacterium]|nr:glycosyltransferase [bacterium]
MSKAPIVSVLMPVHNGERYLASAVASILDQTFDDFELLIVDDGSTDASADIACAGDDSRVRYIRRAHAGLVATLNAGLALARGRYIARMDADDIALPTRLERQVAFLDEHPDIDIAGSFIAVIDGDDNVVDKWHVPCSPDWLARRVALHPPFAHPSVMMRREVIADRGYPDVPHAEDYALWLSLADRARFANVPEVLLHYRRHEASVSTRHNTTQDSNSDAVRRAFWQTRPTIDAAKYDAAAAVQRLFDAERRLLGHDNATPRLRNQLIEDALAEAQFALAYGRPDIGRARLKEIAYLAGARSWRLIERMQPLLGFSTIWNLASRLPRTAPRSAAVAHRR